MPAGYASQKDESKYLPMITGISQTDVYGYGTAVSFGILHTVNQIMEWQLFK